MSAVSKSCAECVNSMHKVLQPSTWSHVKEGAPIPWRTRIDVWEPGARFVDRQIAGPYRWWHHEHRFESVAQGTRVIDHVEYLPRASWLSSWLVKRDVQRIFAYRQAALARILGDNAGIGRHVSA